MKRLLDNYIFSDTLRYEGHKMVYAPESGEPIVMATGTYYNYDAEAWKLGDEGAVWTGYTDKVGFGPQFYSVEKIDFVFE